VPAPHRKRALSTKAPVGAFLPTGASPTDPGRIDPRIQRWGVIGAMEELNGRPIKVLELSGGAQYGGGHPRSFRHEKQGQVEMRRVFDAGQQLGRSAEPWQHRRPDSDHLRPWVIRFFDQLESAGP